MSNLYDDATEDRKKEMRRYADDYLSFLNLRSDRERVQHFVGLAEKLGFKKIEMGEGEGQLAPGDKVYAVNQGKNFMAGVIGSKLDNGFTVIGTHLDVPHLDLKPHFAKECADQGACVLRTHYYGGIKNYQYATTPMILKIAICKEGKTQLYSIGDSQDDPVFTIPDLLIHLKKQQSTRTMPEVVKAEEMNVLGVTSKGECAKFTANFAKILKQKTGITETDMQFCEFQLYPAYPARYVGLDKAAIGAAGQDDGICCFAGFQALQNLTKVPKFTSIVIMHSYEETGSNGTFGAQSNFLPFMLKDLMYRNSIPEMKQQAALFKSLCIAADVTCLYDVNFANAHDKLNAAIINRGVGVERYTGSAGKSGSSEVAAELLGLFRESIEEEIYQLSTLGETDVGGGGTTAKFLAQQLACPVVDIGPGVMNMHSPFEITGVADLWSSIVVYQRLLERQK